MPAATSGLGRKLMQGLSTEAGLPKYGSYQLKNTNVFDDEGFLAGLGRKRIQTSSRLPQNSSNQLKKALMAQNGSKTKTRSRRHGGPFLDMNAFKL